MYCFPRIYFWVRRYRKRESTWKKSNGKLKQRNGANGIGNEDIAAQNFTFRDLAIATNNFRPESLLGDGGFGRVYKGHLKNNNQFVAVKQLDRNGVQGNKEFLNEVVSLNLLHHENLVNLVGYCVDGDQRLLVYEFMPLGSLLDHLLDVGPDKKALDWITRMKIATGAAKGLEYLHDKANPPVVYRDLKSSNILLDESFNPKLSDFGLAHLGQDGDKLHVSSRVIGTYGYCAPEYARTGQLTLKSDVYSFGVVLLELITGRRAIDTTRLPQEQNLVSWAEPIFKDPKKFLELADPLLEGDFPVKELNQAVAVAAICLQAEDSVRPLMADVVVALSFLSEGLGSSQEGPNFDASPPLSDHAPCEEGLEGGVLLGEGSSTEEREPFSKGSKSGGSNGSSSESDDQRSSASGDESEKKETAGGIHGKKVVKIHCDM